MSNSQTTQTVSLNPIKFMISGLASLICLSLAAKNPAMFAVAFFFLYQGAIQAVAYNMMRVTSRFMEDFWVGPANLAVALFMVMSGIPSENTYWGMVWIGIALLFMVAGIRSLYLVMKSFAGGGTETVTPARPTVSAKQLKKAQKQDEALMADLAAFLDGPDTSGKVE